MKTIRHAVLVLFLAFAARAEEAEKGTRLRASLVGTEETPAVFTAGSGEFTARIVDNDTRIEFKLTYENLTAPPLAAHVHFGQRNVAGGVSFFFCGGGGKPACPASASGTVTGSVKATDILGPVGQGIKAGGLDAILQMIRRGLSYANVHTPLHPTGEIRGQIEVGDGDD